MTAESKVSIDEAVKHISETLTQHADSLHRSDTQLTGLRQDTQQEIRFLETRLTSLIKSKHTLWTNISDDMQTLNNGLRELRNLIILQNITSSRSADHVSPAPSPPILNTPSPPILTSLHARVARSSEKPGKFLKFEHFSDCLLTF
jgi:hypothetical protein